MKLSRSKQLILGLAAAALLGGQAFAHVVVKPDTVGVSAFQTFTTGVPNEKDNPTTQIRLVIPDGLKEVSPTVKPGWKIDEKKDGDNVTEITWSGGQIPVGQRDDFTFSAQAPDKETTLAWKAYQTYSDGTVVSWDQTPDPNKKDDDSLTPYSQTKVVNDLTAASNTSGKTDRTPLYVSLLALVVAIVALLRKP